LGDDVVGFPLVGGVVASDAATLGWYFSPGQTLPALFWVVVPSLVGWAFVRALWIPLVAAGRATRTATLTFARHLSGVYFYVYVMLIVGALLLPLLTLLAPADTATLRWCLWCFLFGESFFVPGLMWARLVGRDSSGWVFGRQRYAVLAAYVVLFVVIPIVGMAVENSRGVR
jgi:hypothetical protein